MSINILLATLCSLTLCTSTSSRSVKNNLRIVAMGGASIDAYPGLMSDLIGMTNKAAPSVLIICVAAYDNATSVSDAMVPFVDAGCRTSHLELTVSSPSSDEMQKMVDDADVILSCGGNTQFAADRIETVGLGAILRRAAAQGTVMAGSSAGAILSFDAGHSDSMDPTTLKNPCESNVQKYQYDWKYIRASGLSILPGLFCPHHDTNRSFDGLRRADDFERLVHEHAGESGIGVDHYAALLVEGDHYRVVANKSKEGSVGKHGSFVHDRTGHPGVWRYYFELGDGTVHRALVARDGVLADIAAPVVGAIVPDPLLPLARKINPDNGLPQGPVETCESHTVEGVEVDHDEQDMINSIANKRQTMSFLSPRTKMTSA